jgi:NADH-quinone oxidoreductase subunit N
LFKLSAAPFHFWTPDVYEGAPLIVLMFISSLPKIVVLSVLCFFSLIVFPNLNTFWILIFYITSFFSLFIGTLGGLVQYNLKRLLAYSTIINIGFILMNLLSPNINGLTSAFFYILTYVILLFNIFTIIVATKRKHKTVVTTIYDLQQLFNSNPFMAFIFSISFFSLAGIPPLAGFISKFFVLTNLASYHYYFLAIVSVMFSVIATVYYIRLVKIIYFAKQDSFDFFTVQSRPLAYIISFTFIFNIVLIFFSGDFLNFFKYLFFISF